MKIGIFSRTYEITDLEETYRRMTAQGIYHTQFNLSNAGLETLPNYIDEEKIKEINRLTRQYNITIDALSGTFNMIDPDLNKRKEGCEQFEIQCTIAHMLHIPIVSLCTGSKNPESKWKWHDDNLSQAAWDDLLRSTEQILQYAEKQNVILGVETEASNIINTPERAKKYMDCFKSDRIKIIMDGANLFTKEQVCNMHQTLIDAFEILGQDIVLAHAKDFYLKDEICFVGAGKGILDFAFYTELLKKYKYDGALVMHGLPEEQVEDCSKYLKEVLSNGKISA